MLHSCNVLSVFDSGSANEEECTRVNRTGGQRRDACVNQMPHVCNGATSEVVDTVSRFATGYIGAKAERVTELHKMCTRQKKH